MDSFRFFPMDSLECRCFKCCGFSEYMGINCNWSRFDSWSFYKDCFYFRSNSYYFIYYLNNAPLIGLEYSVPTEGSYLVVSKTLIEAVALVVLAVFPTGLMAGLDILCLRFRNRKNKIEE